LSSTGTGSEVVIRVQDPYPGGQHTWNLGSIAPLLFQFCSTLYERVAFIITTNLRFADWSQVFGDERLTAALLDRLTHHAHILEFRGESYRLRERLQHESVTLEATPLASTAATPSL
jgi:hypothetical protein